MRWLPVCVSFFLAAPTPASEPDGMDTPSVVGKWEALADKEKVTLEFTRAGTLHLSGNPRSLADVLRCARILADFNAKPEVMALTYKPLGGDKLEVESDWANLLKSLGGEDPNLSKDPKVREVARGKVREVVRVAVSTAELTVTGEREKSLTFKRVK